MSVIAESWIMLDGEPFRLDDWPTHRAFYDGRYRRTLLMTARQVAKSTTLANFSTIECSVIPYFSSMFVSPSKEQTVRFSNTRIGKTIRYSPIIYSNFLSSDLTDRVFHKQFTNGSEMLFSYGCDDAGRLRGPSTDRNMYDEVQDMLYDPVITVGNETLSHSDYMYETYAGTPKTMENTIQYLWETSTQTEWVMRCEGCKTFQYIDSDKSLGKDGPICVKCGHNLNPMTGQWIDMNPPDVLKGEDEDTKLKGFHFNQLMMPWNVAWVMQNAGRSDKVIEGARYRWKRILTKHREEPITTFRNEVLGISDAVGTRVITKEEIEALCNPNRPLYEVPPAEIFNGITKCVAGIDWSGGGQTGVSRTVLWIWGFRVRDQKLVCMFYKIYPGQNPVNIIREIAVICSNYHVELVVGDAGEGHTANHLLRSELGYNRVIQVQYGSQKKALEWNKEDRFLADRTTLIDNYFMCLKNKGVEFGPLEYMIPARDEILNEYEEITQAGKRVWRHSPQRPDDCLHAGLYGWVAFKITQNDLRFYQ